MKLYKYVPFERLDILKNRMIRFTQISDFNDPFDLHPSFDLASAADIAALPKAEDGNGRIMPADFLQKLIAVSIPEIQRIQAANQAPGAAYLIDNNRVAHSFYDSKWGILSLTEKPNNILMWSHYADAHKGFVIQFDTDNSYFANAGLRKVEYSQERMILSASSIHNSDVLYRKSLDWAYENEWRVVKELSDHDSIIDERIYLFKCPLEVITGIIVGVNMPHERKVDLMNLCQDFGITIYQTALDKNTFSINIVPTIDGSSDPDNLVFRACHAR